MRELHLLCQDSHGLLRDSGPQRMTGSIWMRGTECRSRYPATSFFASCLLFEAESTLDSQYCRAGQAVPSPTAPDMREGSKMYIQLKKKTEEKYCKEWEKQCDPRIYGWSKIKGDKGLLCSKRLKNKFPWEYSSCEHSCPAHPVSTPALLEAK